MTSENFWKVLTA